MKYLALTWLLYIGPPGDIEYIGEFPTEQACEIAGVGLTDQNHASWVHCFDDPIPGVLSIISKSGEDLT